MPRYFYIGLLVAAVAGGVFFFYRTTLPLETTDTAQVPEGSSFGGVSLRIEYATTTVGRERGLGGRKTLAPDEAMLFVFPKDDIYGFWMKDTLIPLDIFWLDDKGQVVYFAPEVATSSYPNVFYSPVKARYVLETVAGFARAHGVAVGTPLVLKNFPSVSQ